MLYLMKSACSYEITDVKLRKIQQLLTVLSSTFMIEVLLLIIFHSGSYILLLLFV